MRKFQLIKRVIHLGSESQRGSFMTEAALSFVPFISVVFSCIALALFFCQQLALTFIVQRVARSTSLGQTTDNRVTNHIDRTVPATNSIKADLISYGRKMGLFTGPADPRAAIKVCKWDPTTNLPPTTDCATDIAQLAPGDYFTIKVVLPITVAYGAFTATARSSILSRIEN